MVATMSSASRTSLASMSVTSLARWVSTGSPNSRIWYAGTPLTVPAPGNSVVASMSHYFDPAPGAPSRPAHVQLRLRDLQVELAVDRGVFSAGAVDAGTLELLRADPGPDAVGDLLDLGCGYGPIAVTLARRHPDS